jgi:hypothetical protein
MKMETIKISVEVSVNLSENTQNFIKSLFTGANPAHVAAKPAQASAPAKPAAPAPAKPVTPTPTATAAPAPSKPAATPAPAAQAASSANKSIEEVRGMLAKKVNDHRGVIKQKLEELGAPSVTKLDPTKYNEMYDFLAAL